MVPASEHPTLKRIGAGVPSEPPPVTLEEVRAWCSELGIDDVGCVAVEREGVASERAAAEGLLPGTRTLISVVMRMNRENIRSTARSVANLEFHQTGHALNAAARALVMRLESRGHRAVNPSVGFPMEMDRFGTGRGWVISHKPIAVAAGLGHMGIHRNVIHPRFGNFILLDTILTTARIHHDVEPLNFNPCLECKLCVAACPVGAIAPDGRFDFSACYSHNYREFMGGFTDWVEAIADAPNAKAYRAKFSDGESASMWQSLSFGANYKAAYCLAVCPAGEDVIAPFVQNRAGFVSQVLRPLQQKEENVYVVQGSDAEAHVTKKFPHKHVRRIRSGLRPSSVASLIAAMPHVFQRGPALGLDAVYHFRFTGKEPRDVTVTIRDQTLRVEDGLRGDPSLTIIADGETWIGFLRKERNLLWAILRRKVRLKGNPGLLLKFGKCFP
ncbi:MAG: SCP2 sterol-binding domain-containing protein [Myxococcota bacterium]